MAADPQHNPGYRVCERVAAAETHGLEHGGGWMEGREGEEGSQRGRGALGWDQGLLDVRAGLMCTMSELDLAAHGAALLS